MRPRQGRGADPEKRAARLLARGARHLAQGEAARAIVLLERAQALGLSSVDLLLNLGGAHILTGRFTRAVPLLEEASRREPDNAMIWLNLGAAYLGNPVLARPADQERAIAAFERSLELDPAVPHAAYNLGLIYRDRQELARARAWFRRAVETNPGDTDARRLLARLATDESPPTAADASPEASA